MSERKGKHAFDEMYITPDFKLDDDFIRKAEINFGMSQAGAKKHFELLQKIPQGYEYMSKTDREEAESRVKQDPNLIVIEGLVFDIDGKELPGNVAIARKKK